MPCNAHNHHPDCDCGWGGVFYEPTVQCPKPDWSKESSHTTPNAKCPVCSASVFFYKSADGAAVFFDSLGPPWPKHPCTDNRSNLNLQTDVKVKKKKIGWWPFLREEGPFSTFSLPGKEGTAVSDHQERVILIKGSPKILMQDVPLWMKSVPGARYIYEVSTFKIVNGQFQEMSFKAFSLKALEEPEYAKLFPESINLFNSHLKNKYKSE